MRRPYVSELPRDELEAKIVTALSGLTLAFPSIESTLQHMIGGELMRWEVQPDADDNSGCDPHADIVRDIEDIANDTV